MSDNSNDRFYILIILAMIGFFIYWYQTRIVDELYEKKRDKKKIRRKNKHNKNTHKIRTKNGQRQNAVNDDIDHKNIHKDTHKRDEQLLQVQDDTSDSLEDTDISLESAGTIGDSEGMLKRIIQEENAIDDDENSASFEIDTLDF